MPKTPIQIAEEFFAAYADHDIESMTAMFSEDAQFDYVPLGKDGQGPVKTKAVPLWRGFIEAFENFRPEVQTSWEDASQRSALVATINRGIHRSEIAGIKASGKEIAVPHLFILTVQDDELIEKISAYWDNDTFYSQIGRPPAPAHQAASSIRP